MKALLFRPSFSSVRNFPISPDLGLGYLQKVCEAAGHEVEILDGLLERTSTKGLAQMVAAHGYKVVGMKIYSNTLGHISNYLSVLKSSCPEVIVVLGGPHPSAAGPETLRQVPEARFVFAGEGEKGFARLLTILDHYNGYRKASSVQGALPLSELSHVEGLMWREQGTVRANRIGTVEDLDELDAPPWEKMRLRDYLGFVTPIRKAPNVPILTSRGCPYRCTYCAGHFVTGRRVRYRSPWLVACEMEMLYHRFGVKAFAIVDDNFTLDPGHVEGFCEALQKKGLPVRWDCLATGVRLDTLSEPLLALMEQSGCTALSVAVESGSPRILHDMRKQMDLTTIQEKIRLIKQKTRIKVNSYFILGYPEETRQDLQRTVRFAVSSGTDFAQFFLFTPLPGTEITRRLIADGRLKNPDWRTFQFDVPSIPLRDVSIKQLKRFQIKAYLYFYLRPKAFYMLMQEVGSLAQLKDLLTRMRSLIGKAGAGR